MREGFYYAVVDEADSILIDESRNPMIISQPGTQDQGLVVIVDKVGATLVLSRVDKVLTAFYMTLKGLVSVPNVCLLFGRLACGSSSSSLQVRGCKHVAA